MTVYRCTLQKWARDLSGAGARLHGGRWNSPGLAMVYTAENNVLAAFEVAIRIPLEHISNNYVMVPIDLPETAFHEPDLSRTWYKDEKQTRAAGDEFLRANSHLVMKVPSALISDSWNYLLNPAHPGIAHVKIQSPRPILFDRRLQEMMTAGRKPSRR